VKAGGVLFPSIRVVPGDLHSARPRWQSATNLAQAVLKVQRYKALIEANAISRQEYDDALTRAASQCDLASARQR